MGHVKPTNKPVIITGMDFYRASDGKLVEEWYEVNLLALLQQPGVMVGGRWRLPDAGALARLRRAWLQRRNRS